MFKVVNATVENSKGITHTIVDARGLAVAHARSEDAVRAFRDQEKRQSEGPAIEARCYGSDALKGFFSMKVVIKRQHARGDYLMPYSILYSPLGNDLDGNGRSICINESSVCLTAAYEKPKAVFVVGDDGRIPTPFGTFVIVFGKYGTVQSISLEQK